MIRLVAAAAFAAAAFTAQAQDNQPTDKERMFTHPKFQVGCMTGKYGSLPPMIPQRFTSVEQARDTSMEIAGYAICKAQKALPKDATPEQIEAADKAATAEINRLHAIAQENAERALPKKTAAKAKN